jgi:uncharacterized membrane protein YjgN (DUF898 family)
MVEMSIAADGTRSLSDEERYAAGRYPVEFTATASEYFRICIVNLALTIVTLGIYSAWAKVRKRRYLYSHTLIGGEGFDYRAKPLPILKGRLIALGLLIAVFAAGKFVPAFAAQPVLGKLAFVTVLVIAGPWIIVRSFKFNAYNTAYRNIRLRFSATYVDCLKVIAVYGWLLLLAFLYPYFKRRLVEFVAENHYYGTTKFTLDDFRQPFIDAYWSWPSWAIGIFAGLAVFAVRKAPAGGNVQILLVICLYASILMWFAYLRAMTVNALWNSIQIGTVSFQSVLRPRDVIWLYFSNLAAIVLTVGLAIPWAVIRTHRYRASKTTVIASNPLDSFVQAETQQVSATGEEVGEMFDIDVAL